MGSRGPVAKKTRTARTADGKRLRRLPGEADAIFRRLARDVAGLTAADAALVEDTARWVAIAQDAFAGLALEKAADVREVNEGLTVPDTAHGDGTEMRKNPLLIVLRTASEQIRANAQQLGATPLARARMPEPETEQLSLADVLFGDAVTHPAQGQPVNRDE